MGTITVQQITDSLLAIPALLPAMICSGYLTAWVLNLHGFRQRSIVERLFWSVPISLAVSTIAAQLIGKFLSLSAVVVFFAAVAVLWLITISWEFSQIRLNPGNQWRFGWHPLGGPALILACAWVAIAALSLVDFQNGHRLFMDVAMLDQSYRVNWTDAILHTGIPPANPLYWYHHSSTMHNYYAWYVVCAAVSRMAHLPTRAVLIAASIWAGFVLAALNGLYLKHFLCAGLRLRQQFLRSVTLIMVTGLDLCVILWNLFYLHLAPSDNLEAWSQNPVLSWLDTLLWSPHHIAGLACCMFAFLLAWMAGKDGERNRTASVVLIAAAAASAFSLSTYVAFAFFLVMLVWGLWEVIFERTMIRPLLLAAGGVGAAVLVSPFMWELNHTAYKSEGGGSSIFEFAIRQMLPPDGLLTLPPFQHFAAAHTTAAQNLAKLILLVPGYGIELGFYFAVLLIYMVPAWRGRKSLSAAQRSLLVIALATIPFASFIQSKILTLNDFGFRSVLLLQFPLLLLGSEVLMGWSLAESKNTVPADLKALPHSTPMWLRSIAAMALVIGATGTICQAFWFRAVAPIAEKLTGPAGDPKVRNLSHDLYISYVGYAKLNRVIPPEAIVQFNPSHPELFWTAADVLGIDHQTVISSDQPWCGSELGGNPSGCKEMGTAIDAIFDGESAEQARVTCQQYGIQYLVTRVYDPAWNDKNGWVWTLRPVVADEEFRALDCGGQPRN